MVAPHNTWVVIEKMIGNADGPVRTLDEVSEVSPTDNLVLPLSQENGHVPAGFATTAKAFELFMENFGLNDRLHMLLAPYHAEIPQELAVEGQVARNLVLATPLPDRLCEEVLAAYAALSVRGEDRCLVSVRSSVSEDGCGGHQEAILNVLGDDALLDAVHRCFVSPFTNRGIEYRASHGCDPLQASLSVVVQRMTPASVDQMILTGN